MIHKLPELKFKTDALAPIISQETIVLHHGKHLNGYITNLNNLIANTSLEDKSLEEIIVESSAGEFENSTAIFNNAAQTFNHNLYFDSISPKAIYQENNLPEGKLAEMINTFFASFANFKEIFSKSAASLFGSGWVWLSKDTEDKLVITSESNAGCPLTHSLSPILVIDVWEHAYYVDYRNRRADYIEAFWKIIDWKTVAQKL